MLYFKNKVLSRIVILCILTSLLLISCKTNTPLAQHAYLANYKNLIAQAAYNWAITPTAQNGGGFDPNDTTLLPYLQKLAWSGLHETTLWTSFIQNPLNATELQEIETIIEAERFPFYQDTNPKGAPCL